MIFNVYIFIIGIAIIAMFGLPLISVTLNIGNIFGILYGFMLIVISLTYKFLVSKIILIFMLLFLIPFIATVIIIVSATRKKDYTSNTVIVLGCRVKGDKPTLALIERCKAGAKYLSQNENAIAILSGGQGSDELISEAECMHKLLQEYGVDKSRLFIENKSTSTFENLSFSKDIINANGFDKSIAIVSSDYHLYRARMIAKGCGYNDISLIPSRTKWYCVPTFYTREVFGVWAKILKIKE